MGKNKFKVGDIVEFEEGIIRGKGRIVETYSGIIDKSYLVELLGELKGKGHKGNTHSKNNYKKDDYWFVKMDNETLRLVSQKEIHITTDGTTTHAVLKENGKLVNSAKAVCSPEDTFDFEAGARLAMDRVLGYPKKKNLLHI